MATVSGEGGPSHPWEPHVDDRAAMEHALALAERARGRVSPNPPVGCAIVSGGRLVGRGWTQPPPAPHAEAVALQEAGCHARGATAYATLEPCAHVGRTQPCAEALIAAGVARVVYAVADPTAAATGGAARLGQAGVTVEHDPLAQPAASRQLAAHLHAARTGRPLVGLKLAVSLDGRLAAADGTSQWLTGPAARQRVHQARARADAVIVGAGTVAADDPRLTARSVGDARDWDGPQPLRVVLDARAATPPSAAVADVAQAPTLVVVGPEADAERVAALRAAGVEVEVVAARRAGGADLRAVLARLWDRQVREVLVEGGATIAGAVLAAGLADRLEVHVAATVLGDAGVAGVSGLPVATLADAPRFSLQEARPVDDDVVLTYTAAPQPAGQPQDTQGST